MGRYAVIDVGTNSLKMYVGREVHGRITDVGDFVAVTRLGEDLHVDGELSEAAIERTAARLKEFVERAQGLSADKIVAVGTMALRTAKNADEFTDLVKRRCKLRVEILDAEKEAGYAYLAARRSLPDLRGRLTVFDTGGGSTEFVDGEDARIRTRCSLALGSRTLTDRFCGEDPVPAEAVAALRDEIRTILDQAEPPSGPLVGVGGTVVTLATLRDRIPVAHSARAHGAVLRRAEVERVLADLAGKTLLERRRTVGLMPERADVSLAGAAITAAVMERAGADTLTACARGLRHGVFYDRFAAGA